MRKRPVKMIAMAVLILLPFAMGWFGWDILRRTYRRMTDYPKQITIASGTQGGRYHSISQRLKSEIEQKLGVRVAILQTQGSFANILALRTQRADLALYQPGSFEVLHKVHPELVEKAENEAGLRNLSQRTDDVTFIANLYSQPAHLIVRPDAGIKQPADIKGKRVSLGLPLSGDYAVSLVLLKHFGLDEQSVSKQQLSYSAIEKGFKNGTLDAAIITLGTPAPILQKLFEANQYNILDIPYADALVEKHAFLSKLTIPAGLYRSYAPARPAADIHTVAASAQLLAHSDVPSSFVEDVAEIALNEKFLKETRLNELFIGGRTFARQKQGYKLHPGVLGFYEPEMKPLLPSDVVESWEGIRSFVVSFLIAAFFAIRWLIKRRERTKGHRLDQYIRSLLQIEERQVGLDEGTHSNDVKTLQKLLDEVTLLRQEALSEFSAHELNEDRAADCFIEMCHALSDKINAKISRQRLDARFRELTKLLKQQGERTTDKPAPS